MAVDQKSRIVYQIEVDATQAVAALGRVDKNTARIAKNLETAQDRVRKFGRFLRNALVGGGVIAAVSRLANGFFRLTDAASDLNARLSGAAGGGATQVLQDLFEVSQRLGVPLDALGSSFQKLRSAVPTAELGQLTFSLETVTQILATTGAGVQATNSVLLQLSQALGTGRLRGDEFRSIFENAPQLLRAWAQALGRGSESLIKLRDEEAFTTESFIRLNAQIREFAEEAIGFTEPADTVARGFQRISNAFLFAFAGQAGEGDSPLGPFIDLLNQLAEAVVPSVQSAVASLTPVLQGLFDVLDTGITTVVNITKAFSDAGKSLDTTGDKTEVLLEDWEETFLVKLPSYATTASNTLATIFDFWGRNLTALGQITSTVFELFTTTIPLSESLDKLGKNLDDTYSGASEKAEKLLSDLETTEEFLRNSKLFERQFGGADDNLGTGGLLTLPTVPPPPKPDKGAASAVSKAARDALRFQKILEKAARKSADSFDDLVEAIEDSIKAAKEFTVDFEQDINERIILQQNEVKLIRAADADRERLRQQLDLETEARRLRADALQEENLQLKAQMNLAADQLEGGVGARLLDAGDQTRFAEASKEAAEQLESDIEDALDPFKDFFKDLFTDGIGEAEDFTRKLADLLNNVLNDFLDELLNQSFKTLAQAIAGTGTGAAGGTGGGGIGGFLSSIFGGGGGGGLGGAAAATPAFPAGGGDFFTPPGGGGAGGLLGGLAPLAGLGIGSFIGSKLFDSDSGTSIHSTLDPLADMPGGGANVSIVNNGQPLQVDSTSRRPNGDVQLVVSAAVAETTSVYDRQMRRGYGPFAEGITTNTSADRTV